jgi:hypothetical protein
LPFVAWLLSDGRPKLSMRLQELQGKLANSFPFDCPAVGAQLRPWGKLAKYVGNALNVERYRKVWLRCVCSPVLTALCVLIALCACSLHCACPLPCVCSLQCRCSIVSKSCVDCLCVCSLPRVCSRHCRC